MRNSTLLGAAVLALALALVGGCERRPLPAGLEASASGSATRDAPCRPGRGAKLGQPFAHVCPDGASGARESPFWIHAAPVPCSAGEHGEIECPAVVPLVAPETGVPAGRLVAMNVPMVDASTAHRLCAMRFAGRLPTRRERAGAREALGLRALWIVEAKGAAGRHLDFREVPEWVTDVPCDQPSVLGPECGAARAPSEGPPRGEGLTEWSCDAEVIGQHALPIVSVGESCPSGELDPMAAGGVLPCAAGIRVNRGAVSSRFAFQLRCHPSPAQPTSRSPAEAAGAAAVRCVVPESLLDGPVP